MQKKLVHRYPLVVVCFLIFLTSIYDNGIVCDTSHIGFQVLTIDECRGIGYLSRPPFFSGAVLREEKGLAMN